MKAAQISDYGYKHKLLINTNATKPNLTSGEVLVEVYAAGVNPFDWKVREGYMKDFIPLEFPATLGGDVSGIVAEVGADAAGFEVGQEVYGMANSAGGQGSFAEFTPVKAEQLVAKPKSADFVTAAALPLAAVSAYQALVDHINLQPKQKILIHGGAGGIGSIAIQIAKQLGAYIATTAQKDDMGYLEGLGADEIIDYKTQDFSKLIGGYDAVFDTIGGQTNAKSYRVLKPGGILVSMVAPIDEPLANQTGIEYVQQFSQVTKVRLTKVSQLLDDGKIKVNIDKVFPLDQAAEALEHLKTGHPRGKVVIQIT